MRMNRNRRKRRKSGFSLSETLIAILILLMVSAIVAGAIPTASNVYIKTVDAANAQLLLSTTITKLRDEFSTAKRVVSYSASTIEFFNEHGARKIVVVAKASSYPEGINGPGVWVYPENTDATSDATYGAPTYGSPYRLVSQQAATSDMYVSLEFTGVSDGVITIGSDQEGSTAKIQVKKENTGNSVLAEQKKFSVRITGEAAMPTTSS